MIDLRMGDCLHILTQLLDNSVDSIVTDPPYGLSFMGKKWDYDVPPVEVWQECLRVIKPGGHLVSFGGTRTYHRMVVKIEDAGFEIRDMIQWLYGSGFPKSHDISKAIDRAAGAEREVIGDKRFADGSKARKTQKLGTDVFNDPISRESNLTITAPSTPEAIQWQGWGSALKPANEPIVLARKPLEKGLTVAQNVLKWGTGALNIDGSRIGVSRNVPHSHSKSKSLIGPIGISGKRLESELNPNIGRWPANVILDEEAAKALDEQSGTLKTNPGKIKSTLKDNVGYGGFARIEQEIKKDTGGASRFFYVAKVSPSERGDSTHPTMKPLKLGTHLQRMVTPPGGVTLDPFMGSGSFGVSAKLAGFKFIGIEREPEYFEIAKRRIENAKPEVKEPDPQMEFPA